MSRLQDKGDIPMAEVQSLTVNIKDVNDENPIFDQSLFEAQILENATQVRLHLQFPIFQVCFSWV